MAATELIADGTTLANSSDFTLTAGSPRTLYICHTGQTIDVRYYIQHKNSGGTYQTSAVLTVVNSPMTLDGSGVFRAQRQPGANASSLDID